MHLHLGYFEDFKGTETLLLAGEPAAIEQLAGVVEAFGASGAASLRLGGFVQPVGEEHLSLIKARSDDAAGFRWLVPAADSAVVATSLRHVAEQAPAHHYFELVGSPAQLLISAGQYPSEWWQHRPNHSFKPTPLRGAA